MLPPASFLEVESGQGGPLDIFLLYQQIFLAKKNFEFVFCQFTILNKNLSIRKKTHRSPLGKIQEKDCKINRFLAF
jgi:hypothetical protein